MAVTQIKKKSDIPIAPEGYDYANKRVLLADLTKPNGDSNESIWGDFGIFSKAVTIVGEIIPLGTLADGAIRSDGTLNTLLTTYKRTSLTNTAALPVIEVGWDYYYTGNINNTNINAVFYLDAAGAKISGELLVGNYIDYKLTPPANAKYIACCADGAAPIIKRKKVIIDAKKIIGDLNTPQITALNNSIANAQNGVAAINSMFQQEYLPVVYNLTNGYITLSGAAGTGSAGTDAARKRTSTTNPAGMIAYNASKTYLFTGSIVRSDMYGVFYYNLDGEPISGQFAKGTYNRQPLTIPANTAYIGTSSEGTPVIETVSTVLKKNVLPEIDKGVAMRYVDATVAITGDGSEAKPFKTINEAVAAIKNMPAATVFIKEGDYYETFPWGTLGSGDYHFCTTVGKTVRVLGSDKIEGWIKTSGRTNVYETTYNGTIVAGENFGKLLYEDGRPSLPIDDNKRHPLQKGAKYYAPFTKITLASSIEECDNTPGTFFQNGTTLYIHNNGSNDPSTSGFTIHNAVRPLNTTKAYNVQQHTGLYLTGIVGMYASTGFDFVGFDTVRRTNCTVMAVRGAEGFRDNTIYDLIAIGDEAAFCDNDGIGGHFSAYTGFAALKNVRTMSPRCVYYCPFSHHNGDDNFSWHENHVVIVYGMLSEDAGDGGVRISNDCLCVIYNGYARGNGWALNADGGEGFGVVNPGYSPSQPTYNPNKNGAQLICYNCFSEGNKRGYGVGFGATTDDKNRLELIGCISRNNSIAELAAKAGKVVSRNTLATNADPLKLKVTSGTGVIEIINDTLLN